jgi:hypothetical protein
MQTPSIFVTFKKCLFRHFKDKRALSIFTSVEVEALGENLAIYHHDWRTSEGKIQTFSKFVKKWPCLSNSMTNF